MNDKKQQIEAAWKVSEGFDRVHGKINKKKARENANLDMIDYKRENNMEAPFSKKMKDIDKAWSEHEVQQTKEGGKNAELTAKEIKEFMEEQYS